MLQNKAVINYLNKAILIVFGIITAMLIIEGILWVSGRSVNPAIYQKQFKKDSKSGYYLREAQNSLTGTVESYRLSLNKKPDERRVFIVGESVAEQFNAGILKERLDYEFPDKDWEVVNSGIGGSGITTIKYNIKEILDYSPDLIIILLGNNRHGRVFAGRTLMDKLRILRSKVRFGNNAALKPEEKYLRELIELTEEIKSKDVPLILCPLSFNRMLPLGDSLDKRDKKLFAGVYSLYKDPAYAEKIFKEIFEHDREEVAWYLAKSYQLQGKNKLAAELYSNNIHRERSELYSLVRTHASSNGILHYDLDRALLSYSGESFPPGLDYFWDTGHFWPEVYRVFSEDIVDIFKEGQASYQNGKKGADGKSFGIVNNSGDRDLEIYCYIAVTSHGFNNDEALKEIIRYWYDNSPNILMQSVDRIKADYVNNGNSQYLQTMNHIATVVAEKHDYEKALIWFNWIIDKDFNNVGAYIHRGICYYDMGDIAAAQRDFMQLREMADGYDWLDTDYLDIINNVKQ